MHDKNERREYSSETVESVFQDKELIWRLLKYLQPYRRFLVLSIIFLLFAKIIESVIPIYVGRLAQSLLDHVGIIEEEKAQFFGQILEIGFVLLGILFLSYLFDSVQVVLRSWIGQKGLYKLRMKIYDHILHMPLSFFDRSAVGRLMTRTIHDVDQINLMFSESIIPILGNFFLFLGIFIGMVFVDWRIALLFLTILPFVFWLTTRFRNFQRISFNRVRTVVAAMNTFIQEHLMGASIIRNFGLQAKTKKEFEEINEDYCNAYITTIRHFSFFISGIDFFQNISLILAFVLIVIYSPLNSPFEVGTYLTFSLYCLMFFRPISDLAERYNVLQSALSAASRIFHLLDLSTEKKGDKRTKELTHIESIVFQDVWFSYDHETWVLKGVSMEMVEGFSYAVIGETGEGKSTILSLLLQFYEPQRGKILINSEEITTFTLSSLRKQFNVVLQDPVIFSGTIAENMTLFDPDIALSSISLAIEHLELKPFIDQYTFGLEHQLHERGKGLSAGQMQLIALVRTVVHPRSVLILDEATANIDAQTEHLMQKALKRVLKRQTSLVIAHRLSTIKNVEMIFILQNGQIVEKGSHDTLLEIKGVYEKLYRLQPKDS